MDSRACGDVDNRGAAATRPRPRPAQPAVRTIEEYARHNGHAGALGWARQPGPARESRSCHVSTTAHAAAQGCATRSSRPSSENPGGREAAAARAAGTVPARPRRRAALRPGPGGLGLPRRPSGPPAPYGPTPTRRSSALSIAARSRATRRRRSGRRVRPSGAGWMPTARHWRGGPRRSPPGRQRRWAR